MRLIYPHGLGDVIQALPSFARYAEKIGDTLEIGVLARLPACAEVLAGAPFVASVFAVADPWRDYEPRDTWDGYERGMIDLGKRHQALLVWTHRPTDALDPAWCKAYRVAQELGVAWEPQCPDLSHLERSDAFRRGCIDGMGFRRLVHESSGNPAKDVDLDRRAGDLVLPVEGESLAYHRGLCESAPWFIGVDSGPAHLASCNTADVTWVFSTTPIQQAIPLWRDVNVLVVGEQSEALVASWNAWRRANDAMVRYNVHVQIGAAVGGKSA